MQRTSLFFWVFLFCFWFLFLRLQCSQLTVKQPLNPDWLIDVIQCVSFLSAWDRPHTERHLATVSNYDVAPLDVLSPLPPDINSHPFSKVTGPFVRVRPPKFIVVKLFFLFNTRLRQDARLVFFINNGDLDKH